ncbi:MAG: TonB family protein [Terracidiphilus sp.]
MHFRRFLIFVFASLAITFCTAAQEVISVDATTLDQHVAYRVACIYPPLFKASTLQGKVVLQVQVNATGKVESIQVVSGHPMLSQASIDCVKQWIYRPFVKDGKPIAASGQVSVAFGWGRDESFPAAIQSQLEPWLGRWEFHECWPMLEGAGANCIQYKVNISKVVNRTIADIDVEGFQTDSHIRGSVALTNHGIKIVFLKIREAGLFDDAFKSGDVLFELSSQKDKVITTWKKMEPALDKNKTDGVYFEKEK